MNNVLARSLFYGDATPVHCSSMLIIYNAAGVADDVYVDKYTVVRKFSATTIEHFIKEL